MRHKVLRHAGLTLCAAAFILAPAAGQASLNTQQRKALAHSFVDKLKSLYGSAKEKEPSAVPDPLASIPDGQELLLQPYLQGLPFSDNIYGVKHNNQAYLSFEDFINVLYFPIKYDDDTHNAAGWFLREDWAFTMDFAAHKVTSKGKTYSISDANTYMKDGQLLVTPEALALWFGIGVQPNLQELALLLKSDYPFPVQSHKKRIDRNGPARQNNNIAEYPLMDTDYKWLDVKSAQVSASTDMRSRPEQEKERRSDANVVAQGQVAKHSFYATTTMDNQNAIGGVSGQLFKESQEPELLGPLKARAYYLGDVRQTTIPLTPSSGTGLGVDVTNERLYDRYDLSTTVIQGNATPGWDVELYRNNGLVNTVSVGDDGRYLFENVQLFAGDNDFELLFYGPQGEIRRETVFLPVDQDVIAQKDGTYEFAATMEDSQLYRKFPSEDVDEGTLHLSGRYNFLVGDVLNYVGFRHMSLGGEEKDYLSGGLITTALSTIIDLNAAVDEKGEAKAGVQLRHDFGDTDLSLFGEVGTDNFITSENETPNVHRVGAALRTPLNFLPGQKNTLLAGTSYAENINGNAEQQDSATIASQLGGLNVTNTLSHQTADNSDERLDYNPAVNGRLGPFFWRAGASYELKPEKGLKDTLLDVKYRVNENWSSDLSIDHQPQDKYTEYRLGANWTNDNFVLSPFIDYDTDRELYTGVNVRFGLINAPGDDVPVVTSNNITGQGFVSAFVFLDKNGDLKFNGEDEPLPDVMVRSINVARRADTDEKGIALLNGIQANRQTDINLDANTLPDPFMISKYEPRSVVLKPGEIIKLEMPVQYAGELDGTLRLAKHNGTVKDLVHSRISLLPLENDVNSTMQSEALSDGFFVFSLIPPGRYYMVVNPLDAAEYEARRPAPRLIDIGYDAPVLYGQDVTMTQGQKDIDFKVLSEEESLALGFAPVPDRSKVQPYYLIDIQKEKGSKLLNLLYTFNAQKLASQYLNDLRKLDDTKDSMRYFAPGNSLAEAYERCGLIAERGMPCNVEAVLPPSESFAVRNKGIITTDNDVLAGADARKL